MIALHPLADGWNHFFFASEPATTVALFRVLFGAALLANAALLDGDLEFLYGPRGAMGKPSPLGDRGLRACLAVHAAAAVMLTAGAATRASAAVAFATLAFVQRRNPLVTYGGDDVLRVMGFLLIFSRAGDALSVDAWLARKSLLSAAPSSVWCWRLMQIQVSVLYFKAFAAKLAGGTWLDGRAVYYATEVDDFRRRRLPAWARARGWCMAGAWSTMAVEGALGPLVWIGHLRAGVVAAGIAMHLAMEWFLNLYLFGAVMIACLTLFVDPYAIERWLAAAGVR